jgi:hypothetical protein
VEGNAQIGAGLCFHKNQNWKERKEETFLLFFNFISDMKTLAFFRGSLYIVLFVN